MEQFEQQKESQNTGRDGRAINKRIKKQKTKKQQPSEQPVEDCSICYGQIVDKGIIQGCQHTYCFKCIEIWAQQNLTCPQCRVQFSQILRVWKQGKGKRQKMYDFHANEVNSDEDELISLDFLYQPIRLMPYFTRIWSLPFVNLILISSDSE
ncbi:unnamed protein product (macronuclear) [Paramecium tetraurelia]|uniref:RING-type domain-containing protein n=1 Tax=Paramecium tetraurelia TaxID=5888 RepID=A0BES9_PARTE|nr:uncharacterized protein GSPATT00028079001 [Paramecium tetraurelia]CAK57046.1 unnamed protein product [Paramecium tetraurelia]|eukprot:XP_001424444.1 hypothetical protein (macronuclear) [Paramecium tetraurelia strain d4-2]